MIFTGLVGAAAASLGADRSRPLGDPQLDRPTLHSLGVYWLISGDDNRNASVSMEYRKAGAAQFTRGAPLFRVERKAHSDGDAGQRAQCLRSSLAFCRQCARALTLTRTTSFGSRFLTPMKEQKPMSRAG